MDFFPSPIIMHCYELACVFFLFSWVNCINCWFYEIKQRGENAKLKPDTSQTPPFRQGEVGLATTWADLLRDIFGGEGDEEVPVFGNGGGCWQAGGGKWKERVWCELREAVLEVQGVGGCVWGGGRRYVTAWVGIVLYFPRMQGHTHSHTHSTQTEVRGTKQRGKLSKRKDNEQRSER